MTPITEAHVCISITFLTGRYHGEEWPPSPARFYQALLAAVMTCGYQDYASLVEPALLWLERCSPPRIRACHAEPEAPYNLFVPNNDMDVVAYDWQQGRPGEPGKLRTRKLVQPYRVPGDGPHVQYLWSQPSVAAPQDALRTATHLLHTLGWGIDMAFADIGPEADMGQVYEPSREGSPLEVPIPGTLADLRATYARFSSRSSGLGVDTYTRPSMLREQGYLPAGERVRPSVAFSLMDVNGRKPKAVSWRQAQTVAAWLRHVSARELEGELDSSYIASFVQGHAVSAGGDKSARLSYLSVPSITGPYPDGMIRRVLICEPTGSSGEVTALLRKKLSGAELTNEAEVVAARLARPETFDPVMKSYLPGGAGAKVWRSVTPIVLHGFNASQGSISVSKTERLLRRAFEMAGYADSDIEDIAFQSGPFWPGCGHAREIRVPSHLDGYPRLHVQVSFRRDVPGPVLAGIGRHYGLGLFAVFRG